MANKAGTDINARFKSSHSEMKSAEARLHKLQEELGEVNTNTEPKKFTELSQRVEEAKREYSDLCNEHSEVARARSMVSGGTNHAPLPDGGNR